MGATFTDPFCPDCGTRLQRTTRFCPNCRAPAPQSSDQKLRATGSEEAHAHTVAVTPRLSKRQTLTIGICGAVVAVGSLIPWAGSGIFTVEATNGNGFVSLIGGVVMMAAARFGYRREKRTGSAVALVAAAVSFYMALDVARGHTDDLGDIGIGLLGVLAAALLGGVVAIVALLARSESA